MTTNRVDVLNLSAPSPYGPARPVGVDTYFCEGASIDNGALIMSRARLALNRPGDLHDLIILPLDRIQSATVNRAETDL